METQDYTVTERAGPRVAGRRVKPGDTLRLTATEAEYPLGEGTIVPFGGALPQAFATSEASDRLRDEAARFKARESTTAEPPPAPQPAPAAAPTPAPVAAPTVEDPPPPPSGRRSKGV
jgi:hypothetical protein